MIKNWIVEGVGPECFCNDWLGASINEKKP